MPIFLLWLVIVLVIVGLILWVVTQLPIDPAIVRIIRVVVICAVIIWLLWVLMQYVPLSFPRRP